MAKTAKLRTHTPPIIHNRDIQAVALRAQAWLLQEQERGRFPQELGFALHAEGPPGGCLYVALEGMPRSRVWQADPQNDPRWIRSTEESAHLVRRARRTVLDCAASCAEDARAGGFALHVYQIPTGV